jgi:hypothetical protein
MNELIRDIVDIPLKEILKRIQTLDNKITSLQSDVNILKTNMSNNNSNNNSNNYNEKHIISNCNCSGITNCNKTK